MRSHEVDYQIHGADLQYVDIELDPGEGLWGRLMAAGKRMISKESLFLTHFTNTGAPGKAKVGFAAAYPGRIVPVDLADLGGYLIVQRDAFLCAARGTRIEIAFQRNLGTGFFGGEGFIRRRRGVPARGRRHQAGLFGRPDRARGHRMSCGAAAGVELQDRERREPQIDAVRRRRPVLGHGVRHRMGVAAVSAIPPACSERARQRRAVIRLQRHRCRVQRTSASASATSSNDT